MGHTMCTHLYITYVYNWARNTYIQTQKHTLLNHLRGRHSVALETLSGHLYVHPVWTTDDAVVVKYQAPTMLLVWLCWATWNWGTMEVLQTRNWAPGIASRAEVGWRRAGEASAEASAYCFLLPLATAEDVSLWAAASASHSQILHPDQWLLHASWTKKGSSSSHPHPT